MTQRAKNPPTVLGTQVQSLGQKDPLEQGMATHPSILAYIYIYTYKYLWLHFIETETQDQTVAQ